MNKLINDRLIVVRQSLTRMAAPYAAILSVHDDPRYLIRAHAPVEDNDDVAVQESLNSAGRRR